MDSINILKIPTYIFANAQGFRVDVHGLMELLIRESALSISERAPLKETVLKYLGVAMDDGSFDDPQMDPRAGAEEMAQSIIAAFESHWETAGLLSYFKVPTYVPVGRNQYAVIQSLEDHAAVAALSTAMKHRPFSTTLSLHYSADDIVYKGNHTLVSLFTRACEQWDKVFAHKHGTGDSNDYAKYLSDNYGDLIENPDYYSKVLSVLEMCAASVADKYFGIDYRIVIGKKEDSDLPGQYTLTIDPLS